MDTDVLIVGAGPTGLMLANQLMRRGGRAIIIDRNSGPVLETRAIGVHARTLEIYAHLGVARRAIELGVRTVGAHIWALGRAAARIPLTEIGDGMTPYPYLLIFPQDYNEKLLGDALVARGGSVRWSTELISLAQHDDHVVATLRHADGTTSELVARWVAGCDGARSTVRGLCNVAFVGAPYEQVFYVTDVEMTGPMAQNELNVYLWRGGFHLFFPMRGTDHWRIVGILPPALRDRDDLKLEHLFPAIQAEAGAALTLRKTTWFSTYRIHHRRAERLRVGRCFLLGDAAHIHSPVGAQGMNTGLQDAYNLAWKLSLVLSGAARPALLDSYGAERLPVAMRLLGTTDRAFSILVSDSTLAGLFRMRVFSKIIALVMKIRRTRRAAFRTLSQIGIRYRSSALSQTMPDVPPDAPQAGDRFPWLRLKLESGGQPEDIFDALDDTRFSLVLIGQDRAAENGSGLGDLLRTIVIPADSDNQRALAEAGIVGPAYYLLRPDCYIGLAGRQLDEDALRRYVRDRLGVTATTAAMHEGVS
jgi:2-polyprenyl-6-methoxyphenol hydroxylase-like FAD-dependent oxidoreductase